MANLTIVFSLIHSAAAGEPEVRFQAHRGGLREAPENTMAAYTYAWRLGGVPEIDICTAADGTIICLHDNTLARTTDAPDNIKDTEVSKLTLEQIRQCDAGKWFRADFAGQRVPTLVEAFEAMREDRTRWAYLDLKGVDLEALARMMDEYGVAKQVIFCHNKQKNCITLRALSPDVSTMLWIGGKPHEIKAAFDKAAATGFEGLDQVQLHLHRKPGEGPIQYEIDPAYLKEALARTAERGLDLEVLPFEFDADSLATLLDLGIHWYATDEPKRFKECLDQWRESRSASSTGKQS